jgi:molybdopterin-guanine dinucleotide biosynthesis protein A
VSLLRAGSDRGAPSVLAVACDLPYLKSSLVRRILQADPQYDVVCARQDGRFQPLMARYSVALLDSFAQALDEQRLALQPLVRDAHHLALDLSVEELEQLRDWDTPEDVVGEPS